MDTPTDTSTNISTDSPTFGPLHTGDTHDDDGQILDALFEQNSNPPAPPVTPIVTPVLRDPKIPTRLMSIRQLIDPTWLRPTMILPEDCDRQSLTLRVTSPNTTATDGVVILSEVHGSTVGKGFLAHGQDLTLYNHTGALYVLGAGAASVYLDVWSVTK